jgi:caffeoyl-CoA O-methyltransferase
MDIVNPDVEEYAEAQTTPHAPLLEELAAETRATLPIPGMLTGPVEGMLLQFLVWALGARRVLELGTYSGYSAISMAEALPPGGELHTCEIEERHAAVARRYIDLGGYSDRITVHVGPAAETIERLGGEWDLVFIDADKTGYVDYYDAVVPRLSARGLIVADNTLSAGCIFDPQDETARAIVAFNERVRSDPRVTSVLLTVRDGVTLIRRASVWSASAPLSR